MVSNGTFIKIGFEWRFEYNLEPMILSSLVETDFLAGYWDDILHDRLNGFGRRMQLNWELYDYITLAVPFTFINCYWMEWNLVRYSDTVEMPLLALFTFLARWVCVSLPTVLRQEYIIFYLESGRKRKFIVC